MVFWLRIMLPQVRIGSLHSETSWTSLRLQLWRAWWTHGRPTVLILIFADQWRPRERTKIGNLTWIDIAVSSLFLLSGTRSTDYLSLFTVGPLNNRRYPRTSDKQSLHRVRPAIKWFTSTRWWWSTRFNVRWASCLWWWDVWMHRWIQNKAAAKVLRMHIPGGSEQVRFLPTTLKTWRQKCLVSWYKVFANSINCYGS